MVLLDSILMIAAGCGLGGGEKNLFDIAEYLQNKDISVTVMSPCHGKLNDKLKTIGCEVIVIPLPSRFSMRSLMVVRHHLKERPVQLIHCHGMLPALYGRIANRYANRTPIVYTIHGAHYLHYPNRIKKALYTLGEKLLVPWTSRFICVCQSDFERCSTAGTIDPERTVVIHNGVRIFSQDKLEGDRERLRRELNIVEGSEVVLHVGRFHYQKGQEFLIEAIPLVLKKEKDVRFILVGDGPSFSQMRDLVVGLNLSKDRVLLTGARDDVLELLSVSDLFVLSSRWEGLPYTVLEAMVMEKPVVATRVDGVSEAVLDGETGLLVPPENPDALAKAILSLLGNPKKRADMGRGGRKVVEERFHLERMLKETEKVYKQLLTRS